MCINSIVHTPRVVTMCSDYSIRQSHRGVTTLGGDVLQQTPPMTMIGGDTMLQTPLGVTTLGGDALQQTPRGTTIAGAGAEHDPVTTIHATVLARPRRVSSGRTIASTDRAKLRVMTSVTMTCIPLFAAARRTIVKTRRGLRDQEISSRPRNRQLQLPERIEVVIALPARGPHMISLSGNRALEASLYLCVRVGSRSARIPDLNFVLYIHNNYNCF